MSGGLVCSCTDGASNSWCPWCNSSGGIGAPAGGAAWAGATCFLTLSLTVFRPFFATCAREEVFLEVFVFLVDFFIGFVFFVIDFVFFVGGMRLAMAPLSGTRCKIVAVNDGWARIAPSSMRTVAPCFEQMIPHTFDPDA